MTLGKETNGRNPTNSKPSLATLLSGWDTIAHKRLRPELHIDPDEGENGEGTEEKRKPEGRNAQEGRHLTACQGGLAGLGAIGLGGLGGLGGHSGSCHGGIGVLQLATLCQIKALQLLQYISALTQRGFGGCTGGGLGIGGLGNLGLGGIGGLGGIAGLGGLRGLGGLGGLGALGGLGGFGGPGALTGLGGLGCTGGGIGLSGGLCGLSGGLNGATGLGGDHHHGGHDGRPADGYGNEFGGFNSGHRRYSANFNVTTNRADMKEYKDGDRVLQGVEGDMYWWDPRVQAGERRR